VDVKDDEKIVELQVSAEHKHDFVATERSKDLLTAVDLVLDKIDQQIRKYKDKIQDHRHTPPMGGEANHKSWRVMSHQYRAKSKELVPCHSTLITFHAEASHHSQLPFHRP